MTYKILHLVPTMSTLDGGPTRSVSALCETLSKYSEFKIALSYLVEKESKVGHIENSDILNAPFEKNNRFYFFHFIAFALRIIRINRVNIIHLHGCWHPVCVAGFLCSKLCGIPYVVHPRGMLEPWCMAHKRLKKLVGWYLYQRTIMRNSRTIFVTSDEEQRNIERLVSGSHTTQIPNFIIPPTSVQTLSKKRKGTGQPKRLLFLGRLHEKKGLELLFSALSEIRFENWELRVAGSGEARYENSLKHLAKDMGLDDKVQFVGEKSDEEKWAEYTWSDFFILPSFSENFGLTVLESLWAGRPVLASVHTPWKILEESECGWWIDLATEEIVKALLEMINMSFVRYVECSERCRSLALQFDPDKNAKKFSSAYAMVLNPKQ